MKKYVKLMMVLSIGFSLPVFATESFESEDFAEDLLEEQTQGEVAMSKKSSADVQEYDERGNPVEESLIKKLKKQSYKSPISQKNTSSNQENQSKPAH